MLQRIILVLAGILVLGTIYFVAQSFFSDSAEQQTAPEKKVSQKRPSEEAWDGRSDHLYNMQFPDQDGGSLVMERVSYTGLRSPRATAVVRFNYLGSRLPDWLSPRQAPKNFTAFYKGSDDPVNSSLAAGPLDDKLAVIDFTIRNVPSTRLDINSRKGLFVRIRGLLPKKQALSVRISASPEAGYMLGRQ